MRVALGGVFHETNTFSNMRTTWREFESNTLVRGQEIITRYAGTNGSIGGVIDASKEYGIKLIPTIYAGATPGGIINNDVFKKIVQELCQGIQDDIDGVLLVLHGAMVTESEEDAEGYLLKKVREKVGDKIPIVCTTDLHANISPDMVNLSQCLVGFDTYPHNDYYDRAYDAVRILSCTISCKIIPVSVLKKPLIMPAVQKMITKTYPMKDIMDLVTKMEQLPGVVNITLAGGFPYADIKWTGMGVVVTTNNDLSLAEKLASEIVEKIWSLRQDFIFNNKTVKDGVQEALRAKEYPFVIVDSSDNVGGGSSADGTEILAELLRNKVDSSLVIIKDSEAVELAKNVGVGFSIKTNIGGKTDNFHGSPVYIEGVIKRLSDGIYYSERTGERINMGESAVIDVSGITIILTKERVPGFDLEAPRSLGVDPAKSKYIVIKGAVQWKESFGSIAKGWVEVDAKGVTSSNLERFNYKNIRRPIFPLDEIN